ncbi:plasmid pRiA4b ORF-3 family protein [Aquipuribacter nitratireducens]|uniref:Plasmid pRiA4b ORF-3 family protein n=1 Tax=Aquipuribacter nitratireducens TaxID=650104 RepID=A0ABW0GHJ0_9MICO
MRYRVRAELAEVTQPVWRGLELPSDLALDEVHHVLQGAFGWHGYHLHRFAIGEPFDETAEVYLCPFLVDEGEAVGIDARDVRLDELLGERGESCHYAYDYGDGWEVELRLEQVLDGPADGTRRVRCLDGAGAPPPEDCGGPPGFDDIVVEREYDGRPFDPDEFDADDTTRAIDASLRLSSGTRRAVRLERYQWLLDRVGDTGLPLTAAGYLKPVDVRAAFDAWGLETEWIGAGNREDLTWPVAEVREGAMALGLLRRYKGRLLCSRLGKQARADRAVLEAQVARLVE